MSKEYLQYRVADFLAKILTRRMQYALTSQLSKHFYRSDTRGRMAVMANLRHIHDYLGRPLSESDLDRMTRETFRNFGKYLADFFRYTRVSLEDVNRLIHLEHVDCVWLAAAEGRGVLAVTAHLGNWELGGAMLAGMGYPMNVVVLPMKDVKTNELFQSRRERRGLKVIPLGRTVRGIFEALRRKEFVALLADRDYSRQDSKFEFFGRPARLPVGPAKLCATTGAPILPGFLLRAPDDTFILRTHPPIHGDGPSSMPEIQGKICQIMEKEIGAYPSQWYMFDEFWGGNGNGGSGAG